jgi:3-oxoacid CoA-transferase
MINKVVRSAREAVKHIKDGDTILVAGFQGIGHPNELLDEIVRRGVKNLTVVANTIIIGGPLVPNGCVKKFICALPKVKLDTKVLRGTDTATRASQVTDIAKNLYTTGKMEIEVVPQANMIERIRSSGAGIAGFYTAVGADTDYAIGKESKIINGIKYIYEEAIHVDVAVISADVADRFGNCGYKISCRGPSHYMACAARHTVVQADRIVDAMDTDSIHTPGIFVDRVVQSKKPFVIRHKAQEYDEVSSVIAERVARDIPDNSVVDLGYGMPWHAVKYLQQDKEILVHSEGMLGRARLLDNSEPDAHWRGADGTMLAMDSGAAACDFVDSFNMITSGRIDYVLLGAFQVDTHGDFAGWATDNPDRLPAPGASMELARYAKNVYILMTHLDKNGQSKIMDTCTYPVTAQGVVKRIYTDLATLEVTPNGLKIVDIHNGMSHNELEAITGVTLL